MMQGRNDLRGFGEEEAEACDPPNGACVPTACNLRRSAPRKSLSVFGSGGTNGKIEQDLRGRFYLAIIGNAAVRSATSAIVDPFPDSLGCLYTFGRKGEP